MLILYSLIAIFIAWIWVDYYRLIDIYDKESLKYFVLTFFLGCASVLIVFAIELFFLNRFSFEMDGDFFQDFAYCVFKIGMVEEFAKIVPFFVILLLFRKQINEPVDYIVFISVSALGFSATENVLYFKNHGPNIINSRAILATVSHMFDTSLIAYGFIRMKFTKTRFKFLIFIGFFMLAALAHGFYDFWLLYEGVRPGGWIITILYFLITISIFSTILNNALNNSVFFTYKKVIDSDKVAKRLLIYYGIVFIIQLLLLVWERDFVYALQNFRSSLFLTGFIVFVAVVRLSRFKLIQGRWHPVKIEFPFSLFRGDSSLSSGLSFFKLRIKGESYNEAYINIYYEEFFFLSPLSQRNSYLQVNRIAYIEKKIFLKNDETFYVVKIFLDTNPELFETMLIKPKTVEISMVNGKYPIVALLKIANLSDLENTNWSSKNFQFKEWAVAKPKNIEKF